MPRLNIDSQGIYDEATGQQVCEADTLDIQTVQALIYGVESFKGSNRDFGKYLKEGEKNVD